MPEQLDSDPHETESGLSGFRSFLDRVIAEMPGRVIAAITFVAFFFFYGAAINLFKLAGYEFAKIDFPIGVVTGAIGAAAVLIYLVSTRRRQRRKNRD